MDIHTPRFVQKLNGGSTSGGGGSGGSGGGTTTPFNLQVQASGVTVGSGINILDFDSGSVSVTGAKATIVTSTSSAPDTKAVYLPVTYDGQYSFMLPENATAVFYAGPLGIGARWTFTGPKTLTLDMAQLGFGLVVGEAILVVYSPA